MIVILGDSASGKSTIEKALGIPKIVSYTSRLIRTGETDGVDYHYVSYNKFQHLLLDGFFVESTVYNGWCYGIAKEDCVDNSVAIVEPNGFRQLKKIKDINIISFYLQVDERSRVIRLMKRGDDVLESFRRIISDQGTFNGIENEVDFVIENRDGMLDVAIKEILGNIEFIQDCKNLKS